MRRLYPMTLQMPEIVLRHPGHRSLSLANYCAKCARASKTRHLEKFKINISTRRIQTKFCTRKRLNTRSISLRLTCRKFRRVQEIFQIFWIWNLESLAKRWVNIWLFWFVCFDGTWPPVRKVILWGFQWWLLFKRGGGGEYSPRYLH
jgi:hypothetical protein